MTPNQSVQVSVLTIDTSEAHHSGVSRSAFPRAAGQILPMIIVSSRKVYMIFHRRQMSLRQPPARNSSRIEPASGFY